MHSLGTPCPPISTLLEYSCSNLFIVGPSIHVGIGPAKKGGGFGHRDNPEFEGFENIDEEIRSKGSEVFLN